MAAKGVTPLSAEARKSKGGRTSGTERRSVAVILKPGTGGFWGADGVKAAKLFAEQDQIGERLSPARVKLSGRSLKELSNGFLRGMVLSKIKVVAFIFQTESGL